MNIEPCVATIGYFDGVHRGHQFLLEHVKQLAAQEKLDSAVITFKEHPKKVMQPDYHLDLLSTPEEKRQMLKATGIKHVIELDFTIELSQLTAREFMTEILQKQLHVQTLLIGYDHRFGHNRSEGFEDYQRYGAEIGMEIVHTPVCEIDNVNVSSSAIRRFLQGGEITIATHCLGYEYFLKGKVVDGFKLGRKLGFPTANIQVEEPGKLIPADGVYAVRVFLENKEYAGMLNIGVRPTVDNGKQRSIEVHILHFNENIYGHDIRISFVQRIRNEKKFDSLDALKEQLTLDAREVERLLIRDRQA